MKNILFGILLISCGKGVVPGDVTPPECEALTSCNVDQYSKVGATGAAGETGLQGPAGKDGKDAGLTLMHSKLTCSTTYAEYQFTYTTKLFSNGTRFVKCSAMDVNNEYATWDFDEYASNEQGYLTGECDLYGADIDCHDPVGNWKFVLTSDGLAQGVFSDGNSKYNGSVIKFQDADCSDE